MKDINFLPEWYKQDRRLQVYYWLSYTILGFMFTCMVAWSFATGNSLSKADGALTKMIRQRTNAEIISTEYLNARLLISDMQRKSDLLAMSRNRVDVVQVIGELSYLIDSRIVLKKINLITERISSPTVSQAGIRKAGHGRNKFQRSKTGDVKFKISIGGIAANSGDVAEFICNLEESSYFCQVIPTFSRSTSTEVGKLLQDGKGMASEFEITCYLANFREVTSGSYKMSQE